MWASLIRVLGGSDPCLCPQWIGGAGSAPASTGAAQVRVDEPVIADPAQGQDEPSDVGIIGPERGSADDETDVALGALVPRAQVQAALGAGIGPRNGGPARGNGTAALHDEAVSLPPDDKERPSRASVHRSGFEPGGHLRFSAGRGRGRYGTA